MKNKTILALGADVKNRFLVAKDGRLHYGPDIGDLSDSKNYDLFKKEIQKAIKKHKPDIIAHDLHPGYFSTQYAIRTTHNAQRIQHHHAHIASVAYEHSLKTPVIGVAFDGIGFGTDGNLWGGEFFVVNKGSFVRKAHLKYQKMPGGDKVVYEPWRMAASIIGEEALAFMSGVKKKDMDFVISMMKKNINSPLSSSAGRLFDAAAALLGVCTHTKYEAEGPIKLEAMCESGIEETFPRPWHVRARDVGTVIDTDPIFSGMIKDLKKKKDKRVIAVKFHNSIAGIVVDTVKRISKSTGIKDVALSGGVFQNKFLMTKLLERLPKSGFNVFTNEKTPVNDLNIALGQYCIVSLNANKRTCLPAGRNPTRMVANEGYSRKSALDLRESALK